MLKLGLVTYNLAKDWDIPTIIERSTKAGFEAVELRTSHAHGVEPSSSREERTAVKEIFAESRVRLLSLGTVCEYHSVEAEEVARHMGITREFVKLAHDVGATGVKVRPNGLQVERGVPAEKTLDQIGSSLRECGELAKQYDVEIWLEVHGRGTSDLQLIKRIMEIADHESVGVCWNSNSTDLVNGSVRESFSLVKPWIRSVHIRELYDRSYPWRELFTLLEKAGYSRYCLAEIPASPDPERLMHYYHALFEELVK